MRYVFIYNVIFFIGFGFLDNVIMIVVGIYIEMFIGIILGILIMVVVVLGNFVLDLVGFGFVGYVEVLVFRLGLLIFDFILK